jgi:hypothetical protein
MIFAAADAKALERLAQDIARVWSEHVGQDALEAARNAVLPLAVQHPKDEMVISAAAVIMQRRIAGFDPWVGLDVVQIKQLIYSAGELYRIAHARWAAEQMERIASSDDVAPTLKGPLEGCARRLRASAARHEEGLRRRMCEVAR